MGIEGKMTFRFNNKNLNVGVSLNEFKKQDLTLRLILEVHDLVVDEIDAILDSDSATLTIGSEFFQLHGLQVYWANVVKLRPRVPSGLIFACYRFDSCTCGEV